MTDNATRLPRANGVQRLWLACGNSWRGLKAAAQSEAAVRQELLLALVAIPLGVWLGRDGLERALLVGSVILLLIVELLNTAVEVTVDRIGLELHPLSGRAKDIGSAAVLLALLLVAATWFFILYR